MALKEGNLCEMEILKINTKIKIIRNIDYEFQTRVKAKNFFFYN